jgi:hypothetical protein
VRICDRDESDTEYDRTDVDSIMEDVDEVNMYVLFLLQYPFSTHLDPVSTPHQP